MEKNRYKRIVHSLLIVVLSLIAYSNTFNVPFQLDDKILIVESPIIKTFDFLFNSFEHIEFVDEFHIPHRYIGLITFALNYRLHGLDVTGYHIVNFVIHLLNAFSVYSLILLTFRTPHLYMSPLKEYSRQIAFFTALLFACHPVQTEAVTYIWQRVTSLATLFYLLSIITYIRWRLSEYQAADSEKNYILKMKPALFYVMSIISAVFAMKTKQIAFTLPITVCLYECMFFEGRLKKRIIYLIPLFLTLLIIPLTYIDLDSPVGNIIDEINTKSRVLTEISRSDYLFTQFRVLMTYLRLIVVPLNQNLDYDYPLYDSLFETEVFISFLSLLAIFMLNVFVLYRYRYSHAHVRLISFGTFWFFITLSVESSIVPIANLINEYRLYLPSIGIFLLMCTALFVAADALKNRVAFTGRLVASTLAILVLVLTGITYARNNVWKDEFSLWSDVVEKSPYKARGYNELGMYYYVRKRCDLAMPYFQKAIMLTPHSSRPHNNLGLCYLGTGNTDKAIKEFQQAIRENPLNGMYHINLGISFQLKGFHDSARKEIEIGKRLRRQHGKQKIGRHFQIR